mmetsp:Transcript_117659/g.184988  ORF Transcript_117659/g.184988 Transcript_117659/m.184988 type:complete len:278 (-) Transcript_117659:683-1516(-)
MALPWQSNFTESKCGPLEKPKIISSKLGSNTLIFVSTTNSFGNDLNHLIELQSRLQSTDFASSASPNLSMHSPSATVPGRRIPSSTPSCWCPPSKSVEQDQLELHKSQVMTVCAATSIPRGREAFANDGRMDSSMPVTDVRDVRLDSAIPSRSSSSSSGTSPNSPSSPNISSIELESICEAASLFTIPGGSKVTGGKLSGISSMRAPESSLSTRLRVFRTRHAIPPLGAPPRLRISCNSSSLTCVPGSGIDGNVLEVHAQAIPSRVHTKAELSLVQT